MHTHIAVGPRLWAQTELFAGAEGQAGHSQPLHPKGTPALPRSGSGLNIPAEALPGRDGELIRETPYPDSPLAAGAEGSLRDPTFFQRQVSCRRTVALSSTCAGKQSRYPMRSVKRPACSTMGLYALQASLRETADVAESSSTAALRSHA